MTGDPTQGELPAEDTRTVIITFPVPVALPAGWERALDGLVGMVTDEYQRRHPTRVMWPAGNGSLPNMATGEPGPADVYVIDCAEREDTNPHNPERAKRRAELKAQREAARELRGELRTANLQSQSDRGQP